MNSIARLSFVLIVMSLLIPLFMPPPVVWASENNSQAPAVKSGLSLRLEAKSHKPTSPQNTKLRVHFCNNGDTDYLISLGSMFANGEKHHPTKVALVLTDKKGKDWDLVYMGPPGVGGRIDPYPVALRAGSEYILNFSLNQFYAPQKPDLTREPINEPYLLRAKYQCEEIPLNRNQPLIYWQGKLESKKVAVQ